MQPGWDWCHRCGFDPEHLKPADWAPASASVAAPPTPSPTPLPAASPAWPPHDVFARGGPPPTRRASVPAVGQVLAVLVVVAVAAAAVGGIAWVVLGRTHDSSATTTGTASTLPPPVDLVTATGPDGSYTIGLPGTPDRPESLPPVEPGQQLLAWSDDNAFDPTASRGYVVISQAFPGPVTRADQLRALDAMAAQFAADPSASTIETALLGFPARRFAMTVDGRPSSGIALVTDTHLYLVMSTGPNPTDERHAVEDSFRLTTP